MSGIGNQSSLILTMDWYENNFAAGCVFSKQPKVLEEGKNRGQRTEPLTD